MHWAVAFVDCLSGCLVSWVLSKDDGTVEMRKVSDPIREGAEGFLKVQYGVILKLAVFVTVGIFFSYKLRDFENPTGIEVLGSNLMGFIGAVSFIMVRKSVCAAALCVKPPVTVTVVVRAAREHHALPSLAT